MRALSGPSRTIVAMAALGFVLTTAGCAQVADLQSRRALKQAHAAYQGQHYAEAAKLYEEALSHNPNIAEAHFYLANSYDQQYKPSRKGEPENDALLDKAVQHYQTAADQLQNAPEPERKQLGQLSLDYLVATYGPDKLADPAKQEPIIQRMIQLDPNEPKNYWKLAQVYADAGAYAEAEQMYLKARDVKPNDPEVYLQMAGYYSRQGELTKMFEALEKRAELEPNNPEAFQMIAGYYEEAARNDTRLTDDQRRDYIQKGLAASERALKLNAEYVDALVYRNILLRHQARMTKDQAEIKRLIDEADTLKLKAEELRKKQAGAPAAPAQ
jgi:tetratricopeptide (TPR) repeat protein